MNKKSVGVLVIVLVISLVLVVNLPPAKAQDAGFFSWIKDKFNEGFDIGYDQGYWVVDSTGKNCTNVSKEDYLKGYGDVSYYKTKAKCLASIAFKNETGFLSVVWAGIKTGTGWGFDKVLFIIGSKDLDGKGIGLNRLADYFGGGFGAYLAGIAIFLIVNGLAYLIIWGVRSPNWTGWSNIAKAILIGVVIVADVTLWILLGVIYWQYVLTGILACVWMGLIQMIIYIKDLIAGIRFGTNRLRWAYSASIRWISRGPIFLVAYPILMSIPLVNRAIQIITLEVLMPGSWFLRSFILAFYVGVVPALFKSYVKYKNRSEEYEEKLKKEIGERVAEEMGSA